MVNDMVEKLRVIVEQVSNVAREVGTEGNLGGQAIVPNVEGVSRAARQGDTGSA